jgi:hypothetical protein
MSLYPPPISPLVHFRLRKRPDDTSAIKEAATRSIRTAQRSATLNDVVVAGQAAELDAAEPATACFDECQYLQHHGDETVEGYAQLLPPGTQRPA